MAEPAYLRITAADEQPTTVDVILASDPELRFDGQPQRRAICTLCAADGSIAVAVSDLPEDLEHGPRTLAEQLAESMMTGCRIILTGRWATVQLEDVLDYLEHLGDDVGPRRMLLLDGFEHTEEHPHRATPTEFARVDDPWGWPPDR